MLHTPETLPEAELIRLRAAQGEGQHETVAREAADLLARWGDHRDLLLIHATSLRFLGRFDEALAQLDRLAVDHPHFSLMHQERGLCHIARRDAPAAIEALLTAVGINPALPHSWKMLSGVYRLTGDMESALKAEAHVHTLRALPPVVVEATALFADGDLSQAEALTRRFLLTHGDHPEAMRLLAKIGVAHDVLDDAEVLYAGVLTLAPDHRAARQEYVETLIARHKYPEAREALAPLRGGDEDLQRLDATIAVGLGHHEEAIALYHAMLARLPAEPGDNTALRGQLADLHLWLGHALKTLGRVPEAIAAYTHAAALRPEFGDAWWSLANLKTYRFTPEAVETMRKAEEAPGTIAIDRVHLNFALGKALEDAGDAASSWHHYARGNALQREASQYRPEILETNTRLQKQVCTSAFFTAREGWGAAAPDPIFVLGLPRSGSTLIEQILASHPEIEGTQELPDIQRIVLELQGREHDIDAPAYPGSLADLTPLQCRALGERYLAETQAQRSLGRPFFIDKMPNNFRHIGLIHLILPNAKIIDTRRDPMSCCFSNLKQLFAQGQEFTYSIEDIARYYRTYLELMRHWDEALPGRVLRVLHEDVIEDLETQVRRLLDHCGLPFDEACLNFHQNRRAVRTPSSEQVRRPIFRDGMDQWRAFEPFLDDLKTHLGSALTDWR
ncbi:sulfotransferase family protein [Novosphingobium terrae]|uniref:sulfotransferase family protein n=1 Tax=Novosphingobium terrae TaxID=2726189 RepID=UPI001981A304|nr:sulfotransferase [Novosphingobium terrae]